MFSGCFASDDEGAAYYARIGDEERGGVHDGGNGRHAAASEDEGAEGPEDGGFDEI